MRNKDSGPEQAMTRWVRCVRRLGHCKDLVAEVMDPDCPSDEREQELVFAAAVAGSAAWDAYRARAYCPVTTGGISAGAAADARAAAKQLQEAVDIARFQLQLHPEMFTARGEFALCGIEEALADVTAPPTPRTWD